MAHAQVPRIDKDKLKKELDVSNFDPNAVLRGAQLTLVGGTATSENHRQRNGER